MKIFAPGMPAVYIEFFVIWEFKQEIFIESELSFQDL